ncbi:MAG: 4-(cytidine 5'-diphospho)-2-C-methyl-D-erythritol kinase [Bacteroidota bacterium]|nr:4-(cytidine 5'-diphospho)-2-C-methyl-D-erythritol kinase [Bacteroidota bacterium]
MVVFPNAKINLGLNIIRKREDGYHDLETIFYPLLIQDIVEVITNSSSITSNQSINFSATGLPVNGDENNNLCIKAYRLLKKDFPTLPSIQMHLHKTIPMGAGLGGGSADGAFVLRLLNEKYQLALTPQQLIEYALQLGSDCPFFIVNQPCFATGRGEHMKAITLNLSAYHCIIVNPGIHVATGWAFSQLTPQEPIHSLQELIQAPVESWKETISNDFEQPVFKQYPAIEAIKKQLYNAGAVYAAMSGSGSTVFGLFEKENTPKLAFPSNYFVRSVDAILP